MTPDMIRPGACDIPYCTRVHEVVQVYELRTEDGIEYSEVIRDEAAGDGEPHLDG